MDTLYNTLEEIRQSEESQDIDTISVLRVRLARLMGSVLSPELAKAKREYAAKWIELRATTLEDGKPLSVAATDRLANNHEVAQKIEELDLLWKACEQTLNALASRIHVLSREYQNSFLE